MSLCEAVADCLWANTLSTHWAYTSWYKAHDENAPAWDTLYKLQWQEAAQQGVAKFFLEGRPGHYVV